MLVTLESTQVGILESRVARRRPKACRGVREEERYYSGKEGGLPPRRMMMVVVEEEEEMRRMLGFQA